MLKHGVENQSTKKKTMEGENKTSYYALMETKRFAILVYLIKQVVMQSLKTMSP